MSIFKPDSLHRIEALLGAQKVFNEYIDKRLDLLTNYMGLQNKEIVKLMELNKRQGERKMVVKICDKKKDYEYVHVNFIRIDRGKLIINYTNDAGEVCEEFGDVPEYIFCGEKEKL